MIEFLVHWIFLEIFALLVLFCAGNILRVALPFSRWIFLWEYKSLVTKINYSRHLFSTHSELPLRIGHQDLCFKMYAIAYRQIPLQLVFCFCRRGAAEVRKQVSSAYLGDLPKSISGLNLASGTVVSTEFAEGPLSPKGPFTSNISLKIAITLAM